MKSEVWSSAKPDLRFPLSCSSSISTFIFLVDWRDSSVIVKSICERERSYFFSFCAGPHKFFHFFLDLFIFQHLKNRLLVLVFDHEALIEAVAEPLDRGLQALNILSLFLVLSLKPKYLTLKLVLISQVAFVDLLGFVEFFLE